jgi:hypothetical protein
MKSFELNDEQVKQIREWMEARDLGKYSGACGGRFTYCFTPTSIGVCVRVEDAMGPEPKYIDVSNYEDW